MEIYLEFAENKAIGAKRQGQQEESTLERIRTQKLHGCGERSSAAAQPFVKVSAFNARPASPGSSPRISRAARCRYPPGTCPASHRF